MIENNPWATLPDNPAAFVLLALRRIEAIKSELVDLKAEIVEIEEHLLTNDQEDKVRRRV